MKKLALLTLCVLPFFPQANASEFTAEPAATAYWQIPLAVSKTGKEQQFYGFRLDQVVRDNTGNLVSSFSAPLRAPAVDFRFNEKGLNAVYVHGVNLSSPAMMNLAGEEMVWWIVGGTVAGMVGLAIWADDKGDCDATYTPKLTGGLADYKKRGFAAPCSTDF